MLEKIAREIRNCRKCELWKTRRNAVPGEGSEKAQVMFIGEAPGKIEDETGRPFAGRAGKILDEWLSFLGLTRKEVFITSVLKCRPPGNREPRKIEIRACKGYLLRQIEVINPKLIVLLGSVAVDTFLGEKSIKNHGKLLEGKYFILFHPAAVLYNPRFKEIVRKDLEELKVVIEKLR
jgi:DNA polymerase